MKSLQTLTHLDKAFVVVYLAGQAGLKKPLYQLAYVILSTGIVPQFLQSDAYPIGSKHTKIVILATV